MPVFQFAVAPNRSIPDKLTLFPLRSAPRRPTRVGDAVAHPSHWGAPSHLGFGADSEALTHCCCS
jgi:hypothetical protein